MHKRSKLRSVLQRMTIKRPNLGFEKALHKALQDGGRVGVAAQLRKALSGIGNVACGKQVLEDCLGSAENLTPVSIDITQRAIITLGEGSERDNKIREITPVPMEDQPLACDERLACGYGQADTESSSHTLGCRDIATSKHNEGKRGKQGNKYRVKTWRSWSTASRRGPES